MAGTRAVAVEVLLAGIRDTNDNPLASGKVYTYQAGTTTLKTTWDSPEKTNALPNPITLDSNGRAIAFADGAYRFVIKDSSGTTTIYDWDNLYYSRDLPNNSYLQAGNAAGTGLINLLKANASGNIEIGDLSKEALLRLLNGLSVDASGNTFTLRLNTADGSDNKELVLAGGGGGGEGDTSRGGVVIAKGNEAATNGGSVLINTGNAASAKITQEVFSTGGLWEVRSGGTQRFGINDTGVVTGSMFDWVGWTPSISAGGSMTVSNVNVQYAKYILLGKMQYFILRFFCDLGGTASNTVIATIATGAIAFDAVLALAVIGNGYVVDPNTTAAIAIPGTNTQIVIKKHDSSNFNLGIQRIFNIQGFFAID